jgi:hypothetical protein
MESGELGASAAKAGNPAHTAIKTTRLRMDRPFSLYREDYSGIRLGR